MLRRWAKLRVFGRHHARSALITCSVVSLAFAGLASSSGSAGASVSSDQSDITQLEQQIAAQGAQAQALVSRYDQVQARVNSLDAQIAHDRTLVTADQKVEATATAAMQTVAVTAYVSGSGTSSAALNMFSGTWSVSRMLEQNQYLGAVNTKLDNELVALHLDQVRTQDAQRGLRSEETQAKHTLDELATAHDAATAAIASDEAALTRVKGDLRSVLAAANAQRHAAEQKEERELAAAKSPAFEPPTLLPAPPTTLPPRSSTTSPLPPTTVLPPPTPSPPSEPTGYANPLRDTTALSPERIDQGVDYGGFGPVYAIGDGVVLTTVASGWPGGTFIAYQLTDGPASGLVVYVAEDLEPSVQVGSTVTSSTVVGQMYAGPEGIETGWADSSSLPDTMARSYGQFNGSNSSAFGSNFSQLLQALGAPGGIVEPPVSGAVPGGWPTW